MDDASTDGTAAVVSSYGDDRVRHHRQTSTRGIYGNVNDGIALARGELIAAYHGDDVYLPTIVEKEVAFLEAHPDAGAVFCSDVFIDADGREFGRLELPEPFVAGGVFAYDEVLNGLLEHTNTFLRCPSAMVRAEVHREVGVYRDHLYKNTSDVEMWLRIARRYGIGILPEHLFLYRRGHSSSSERYHRLRTDPSRQFAILDECLAERDSLHIRDEPLAAYRGHRAVDRILVAVSRYILGRRREAAQLLREVGVRDILRSRRIQRGRMVALLLALRVLVRLPRVALLAGLFYRHWHQQPNEDAPLVLTVRSAADGR